MLKTWFVIHLFLLWLLNLSALNVHLSFVFGCHEAEREALLNFKRSLIDPENLLSSWKGKDCCNWDGVGCNNVTANVNSLDLSNRFLGGTPSHAFPNLTSLRYLSLSENNFHGSVPLAIRNMRKLEYLSLYNNSFRGVEGGEVMGILGNLCKLKTCDLAYILSTKGSMGVHQNLSKCITYDLEDLDLRGNKIGTFPSWLGNFRKLRTLYMSDNRIGGPLPESIGSLAYLNNLQLSGNNFTSIPTSIGNLLHLERLDLPQNSLNGTIPEGLKHCKSLVHLDLSSNFLQDTVSESHLDRLSRLEYLDLSFNALDSNLSSNWTPPFQLSELHMKSCKIQSQFPQWLRTQTKLRLLDLSDNMMSGELLDYFPSKVLEKIRVSNNRITGPFPYFLSTWLLEIDLSYNSISGPLINPPADELGNWFCNLSLLTLLNLQENKLSGFIPDCGINWEFLNVINLSYNQFSGNIPTSFGLLSELMSLKLNNNALEGHIPPTLNNCTELILLDLSENKLSGKIPSWRAKSYPSPSRLNILMLRGNQFEGIIPPELCSLSYLQILDLAGNQLIGNIPRCLGNITGMGPLAYSIKTYLDFPSRYEAIIVVLKGEVLEYHRTLRWVFYLDLSCNDLTGTIPVELTNLSCLFGLNLSHNHLTGNILKEIGDMISLESLDLSSNNLSGTIPLSISALAWIAFLNLSHNQLHGQIPTGKQLQALTDPSIYIGNSGLCGDPLPNQCNPNHAEKQSTQGQEEPDKEDDREKPLLYFVIFSGFATGFWGIVGSLVFKRRFRFALFQLVSRVTDYFYIEVMIRVDKLRN